MIPGGSMPGGLQSALADPVMDRLTPATGHPKQIS